MFFFRVLLSKKEKQCGKLSLNSKLLRTDYCRHMKNIVIASRIMLLIYEGKL
jgi:hypothetical protein